MHLNHIKPAIDEGLSLMSSINSDRVRDFLKGLYSSSLDSTIVTAGNGGSHANASHLTADLIRRNVPSICLTDNQAALSAFSNDFNYDTALSRILSNQFRFCLLYTSPSPRD